MKKGQTAKYAGAKTFEQAHDPEQFRKDTLRLFRTIFHRDPILPHRSNSANVGRTHSGTIVHAR